MQEAQLTKAKTVIGKSTLLLDWQKKISETEVTVKPNQELLYLLVQGLGNTQQRTIRIKLSEQSSLRLFGITVGVGEEKLRTDLTIMHAAPGATSFVSLKGLFSGSSFGVLNGMIHIMPRGQKANARLEERVLLLSPQARAETIPNLEIEADDVKAGHAATVSKLAEEEIFYLETRGLTREQSEHLIIRAFIESQFLPLPAGKLRAKLEAALNKKIAFI